MSNSKQKDTRFRRRLSEGLGLMQELLEEEREALLKGDAREVSRLAGEKEKVGEQLSLIEKDAGDDVDSDLRSLARNVGRLSISNHALLEQMHRHYNGMLELFMKMGGRSTTYGADGMIADTGGVSGSTREILA